MSRAPFRFDRFATGFVGLVLIAGGLLLIDWKQHIVRSDYPRRLQLGRLVEWSHSDWWPWATAAAGVVLALLGLYWLLAHLRRARVRSFTVPATGDGKGTGMLTVEAGPLESVVAQELIDHGPVTGANAKTVNSRRGRMELVTAPLDDRATGDTVRASYERLAGQIVDAFPGTGLQTRLVLDKPRRTRGRRSALGGPGVVTPAPAPRADLTKQPSDGSPERSVVPVSEQSG
ncbi:hypothetical protein [Flexivirga meconopsidis]|uniref:hypothetical protein n=1 Tax=Flexivirga meconopsidis TaxID=2977121 RepID=UPI00223F0B47|nr:hypothetical protein [Flexivirga meconopsidis]